MWLGALGCAMAMAQPAGVQPLVQPEPGVEVSRIDIAEPLQRESHDAAPLATLSPFFDTAGMVLHANTAQLPEDCTAISGDAAYTVHAGTRHALPGTQEVFAYDIRKLVVPPCSRVTVTLVNDDATRHQWLLQGLPFALYPGGFRAVGAKIKYAELTPEVIGNAHAWVLANKDLKIIHLKRQNLLRRLVSHELAVQSGVNMVLEGGPVPEYKSLQLDFEACTRDFDAVRAEEERFAALFADHPVIDVTYERVADPSSGECERILDFLGVPHAPLHTPMVKLGRDDLSESVGNYDELRRQAQGTRYAHYFD